MIASCYLFFSKKTHTQSYIFFFFFKMSHYRALSLFSFYFSKITHPTARHTAPHESKYNAHLAWTQAYAVRRFFENLIIFRPLFTIRMCERKRKRGIRETCENNNNNERQAHRIVACWMSRFMSHLIRYTLRLAICGSYANKSLDFQKRKYKMSYWISMEQLCFWYHGKCCTTLCTWNI